MTEADVIDYGGKIAGKFIGVAVRLALLAVLYVIMGSTVDKVWHEPVASLAIGDFAGFAFAVMAGLYLIRRILITLFEGWSIA